MTQAADTSPGHVDDAARAELTAHARPPGDAPYFVARSLHHRFFEPRVDAPKAAPDLADRLRVLIAESWAAGDAWNNCVETLGAQITPAATALRWLAATRHAVMNPNASWPPTIDGDSPSNLALQWLSLFVERERGASTARLDTLCDVLIGTTPHAESPVDVALVRAVMRLRRVDEVPPLARVVDACVADQFARAGRHAEAANRFDALVVACRSEWSSFAADALHSARRCRDMTEAWSAVDPRRLESIKLSRLAASPNYRREGVLTSVFARLAGLDSSSDGEEFDEPMAVLTAAWFGDVLAGALAEQRSIAFNAASVLARVGRWARAIDFALDIPEASAVTNLLKRGKRSEMTDLERIEALSSWQRHRSRDDTAGAYAALAPVFLPLLEVVPIDPDISRLGDLAEHGPVAFLGNVDVARPAVRALGSICLASLGVFGRGLAKRLLAVALDDSQNGLLRIEALKAVADFWDDFAEESVMDPAWTLATGASLLDAIGRLPNLSDDARLAPALSFLVGAVRSIHDHPEARPLAERLAAVAARPGSDPIGTRRRTLLVQSEVADLLPVAQVDVGIADCLALLTELRTTAEKGTLGRGIRVPIGIYDPVFAAAEYALRRPDREAELLDALRAYAANSYLSDTHRLRALHALGTFLVSAPNRIATTASSPWVEVLQTLLAVTPHPTEDLFEGASGSLQVTAETLLSILAPALPDNLRERCVETAIGHEDLLSPSTRSEHWQALGAFARHAQGERAAMLALRLLRASGTADIREATSAWLGLVASLGAPLSEALRHGIERDLLALLRRSTTPWWVRRDIIGFAATEARHKRLRLSDPVLRQTIAIGNRDRFQPVRFHARRLERFTLGSSRGTSTPSVPSSSAPTAT